MKSLGAVVVVTGHYEVTVTEDFPIGSPWVGVYNDRDETEALIQALTGLLRAIFRWRRHHPGYGAL